MIRIKTFGWGFDCLGASVGALINAKAEPTAIWPYDTGSDGYPWTDEQIAHFTSAARLSPATVFRVNQGYLQGPGSAMHGDEFDLERGTWTMPGILDIIAARRQAQWSTRVYCTWSNYGLLKQSLAQAGTGRSVWFRIADWNLSEHFADLALHGDVYAGQWASPASNPQTLVPGTSLTVGDAQVDLNVLLIENTGWVG